MNAESQERVEEEGGNRAAARDALLQAALDFIGTLTGMVPPPIETAPPETFAPFYAFVDRVQAITAQPGATAAAPGQDAENVAKAMRRAYYLGQTYWQQAYSEYTSQHRKADETRAKFDLLVTETVAALAAPGAAAAASAAMLEALQAEQEWRDRDAAGALDPEWDYERMVGDKRRAAIARAAQAQGGKA